LAKNTLFLTMKSTANWVLKIAEEEEEKIERFAQKLLKSARDLCFEVEAYRLDIPPVLPSIASINSSPSFPAIRISENGEDNFSIELCIIDDFLYEIIDSHTVNKTIYLPSLLSIIRMDSPLFGIEFLTIDGLSYTYKLSSLLRDSLLALMAGRIAPPAEVPPQTGSSSSLPQQTIISPPLQPDIPPPLALPPTLMGTSQQSNISGGLLISSRRTENAYKVKGLLEGDYDYEADLVGKLVSFKREENLQESLKEAIFNLQLLNYSNNEGKQTLIFLIEKLIGFLSIHSNSDFLNFIDLYQNQILYGNLTLPNGGNPPSGISAAEWKKLLVKRELALKQWEIAKNNCPMKVSGVTLEEESVQQLYHFIEGILKILIIFFSSK
jgi:hypothetical protein